MKIACPICSIEIEVTEEHIGHKGRCTCCESKFIIPATPDGKFEILHRGEAPEKMPKGNKALVLPPRSRPFRHRKPLKPVQVAKQANPPLSTIAAVAACVAVAVAIAISASERGDAARRPTPTTTAVGKPATAQPPLASPATPPQPSTPPPAPIEQPEVAEAPPVPTRAEPQIAPAAPPEPEPPMLTEAQKASALAFLKSEQKSKRAATYAAFRNLGERERPTYLELLVEAREFHSGTLGERAYDLAIANSALGDFKTAYDAWIAVRDPAKEMVQTDWKDKQPGDYQKRHAEMDETAAQAAKEYVRTIRAAERAGRFQPSGFQDSADALAEIRAEIAFCHSEVPGAPLTLREELAQATRASAYLEALATIDVAKKIAAEHDDANKFNAASSWASGAYQSFANLLNERRVALGLQPLRLDENLSKSCAAHSADMAANGYFSHAGLTPETKDFGTRAKRASFSGFATGECIFMGSPSPTAAHQAWWYSDGHRLIMYSTGPNTLGLGLSGNHWTLNTGKQ